MAAAPAIPVPATLPLPQRLALAYAPQRSRGDIAALWQLDSRLAGILQSRGEALIAQIKLAWWRDRLAEDPQVWPMGEPLLQLLRIGKVPPRAYLPLVDGWERLLDEDLTAATVREFAAGRAAAWRAVAEAAGAGEGDAGEAVDQAAREISYLDLALHLGDEAEAKAARQLALACKWHRPRLPRALRPLAVLHALSARALQSGSHDLLDGPRAGLLALRIGLFGR
jgi:phytoene synthase